MNIIDASDNLQPGQVDALPNQIKSLFDRSDDTRKRWHSEFEQFAEPSDSMKRPENLGMLLFNYKLIKQVEVLVGYEKSVDDVEQPKYPIFELLTRDKIQSFENEDVEKLLCRIVSYRNNDFPNLNTFVKTVDVELPLYEQYFIISKTKSSTRLENPHDEGTP